MRHFLFIVFYLHARRTNPILQAVGLLAVVVTVVILLIALVQTLRIDINVMPPTERTK